MAPDQVVTVGEANQVVIITQSFILPSCWVTVLLEKRQYNLKDLFETQAVMFCILSKSIYMRRRQIFFFLHFRTQWFFGLHGHQLLPAEEA